MTSGEFQKFVRTRLSGGFFTYSDDHALSFPQSLGFVIVFGHRNQRRQFKKMMRTQYYWKPAGIEILFREVSQEMIREFSNIHFISLPGRIRFDWSTKKLLRGSPNEH